MSELILIIGNKNYSSWSLRSWLALRRAGIPFKEIQLSFGAGIERWWTCMAWDGWCWPCPRGPDACAVVATARDLVTRS